MSKTVQLKRGNANVSASYVGAEGEITVNTTDYTLNVHDGVTPGGYVIIGLAGSNIGNLNFSNQTITGLNANANIVINTGNASLTIQGNASADYFLGNGSLLSGMNTYSNSNVQSLLSNYSSPIISNANITAGYFLGNGALLTGINQAGFGNIVIQDQTISGKNEPAQALTLGNGNVFIQSASIISANLIDLGVDGTAQFNTISVGNSVFATTFVANFSMGVLSSNTTTGYYFTPNTNVFTSTTGLTHRNQSVSDPNVSVLALSHDVPVALFFSNGTNQLIGSLIVTGTDRPYGLFPDANISLYANTNSYSQIVHQNLNEGQLASTDMVLTADNGDDSTYYVDLGIGSSTHDDPEFFGDTTSINDAYLYITAYDQAGPSTGNIGNLIIGSTNGIVKTFVGNTAEANVVTVVDATGLLPGANVTYSLGSSTRQWRDLWLSNNTLYIGGTPITVSDGVLSVNGSPVSGNGGGNYGNANVAAYLPTYTGNVNAGNINSTYIYGAQRIYSNAAIIGYGTDGSGLIGAPIIMSGNSTTSLIGTNGLANNVASNLIVKTLNSNISLQLTGVDKTWTFDVNGGLELPQGSYISEVNNPGGFPGYALSLHPDVGSGIDIDQQLLIYPTGGVDANHLHITSGNLYNTELYLGNDNLYVKLANTGNVVINSNDNAGNIGQWTFGVDGTLTIPGDITNGNGATISFNTNNARIDVGNSTTYIDIQDQDLFLISNTVAISSNGNSWDFAANGNLILPSNSSTIIYPNGASILSGFTTPTAITNGNGSVSVASGDGNISFVAGGANFGHIRYGGGVALGATAGNLNQGLSAVAIGSGAATENQGYHSVAIGWNVGQYNQGTSSIAIGENPGYAVQGNSAIAIGAVAARSSQSDYAIAMGTAAGFSSQGANAVAIGTRTAQSTQGANAVAIGTFAGNSGQGVSSIAIGVRAGNISQGSQAVAIGVLAGQSSQGTDAVAIGSSAGAQNQLEGAVAIGQSAGVINQGVFAVAIGSGAGYQNQANNSIAITATGTQLSPEESGFYIDPVRNDVGNISQIITYNTTTKEITYSNTISIAGNITAGNISSNVNGFAIGYRDIPQVVFTSNATLALSDAGKHYFSSNSANVITVPNNATVSFSIGTAISIVQQGTANLTVTPGSGVTMYLAGNSTSASRTLGNFGMATLMKVGTDTWFINGTGVN